MDVRDSGVSSIPCDRHNRIKGLKPFCRYLWKNHDNNCDRLCAGIGRYGRKIEQDRCRDRTARLPFALTRPRQGGGNGWVSCPPRLRKHDLSLRKSAGVHIVSALQIGTAFLVSAGGDGPDVPLRQPLICCVGVVFR
jgi:hypothetical protein